MMIPSHWSTGSVTTVQDDLRSPDLSILLNRVPPSGVDRIASLIVDMHRKMSAAASSLHLERSTGVQQLRGRQLIPDVIDDLRSLARHAPLSAPDYRTMLKAIAQRHGVNDNGSRPPAGVEKELQRRYAPQLRPDPETFSNRGPNSVLERIGFSMPVVGWGAYALSPNWWIVTAATLEIAAQRRIALTRALRTNLES